MLSRLSATHGSREEKQSSSKDAYGFCQQLLAFKSSCSPRVGYELNIRHQQGGTGNLDYAGRDKKRSKNGTGRGLSAIRVQKAPTNEKLLAFCWSFDFERKIPDLKESLKVVN